MRSSPRISPSSVEDNDRKKLGKDDILIVIRDVQLMDRRWQV